jgi:methyltransferase OMS1
MCMRTYASRAKLAKKATSSSRRPPHRPDEPTPPKPPLTTPVFSAKAHSFPTRNAWSDPSALNELHQERPYATLFTNVVLVIAGTGFAGLLGFYGVNIYKGSTQPPPDHNGAETQKIDLTAVYDENAQHFDKDVDRTEYWNGIMTLRSRLVKQARGDVLESAAGTGRNSEYYVQSRIRSLAIVDKSRGMLTVAEKKWPEEREGEDWTGRVRFVVGDVEDDRTTSQLGSDSTAQFDTVVQTLGLCSTDDPDGLMRSLTKLVKPGGKILLLEHGRGYFDWLNRMLDRSAHQHAAKHGCWWNRDIGAIVQRSDLETVEMSRPWRSAGTNWYIILRKPLQATDVEKNLSTSGS